MFDIGLGEIIVLGVLALVIFGPDQLPKAAASAGAFVRQLRQMAQSARSELGADSGLDSISDELQAIRDLHPKRIIASAIESPEPKSPAAAPAKPATHPGASPVSPPAANPSAQRTPPAAGYDPDAT